MKSGNRQPEMYIAGFHQRWCDVRSLHEDCPWNLEGLFADAPFRWAATNIPASAPLLAGVDDMAARRIERIKKWWWF